MIFFGTYMFGCANATGQAPCDPSWNEIDELVFNNTNQGAIGETYGTSLFISKSPPAATSLNQGFKDSLGNSGASAVGLYSNHDSTGTCSTASNYASSCTAAMCAAGTCSAMPLCCPVSNASLVAKGVPATVAGGAVPTYTRAMAQAFSNYKLVWTPNWIAWMINEKVMRNETTDVRSGAVPWRPVGMRCVPWILTSELKLTPLFPVP